MSLKVFVVGQDDSFRESIVQHIMDLGHTAVAAMAPETCPFYHRAEAICSQKSPCGDAIILMQTLPAIKGIDFIKRRMSGGCKGVARNNAVILGPWSGNDKKAAENLGCHFFETPMNLSAITLWLSCIADTA